MSSPVATDVVIVNYYCADDTATAAAGLADWPGTLWVVDNSADAVESARLAAMRDKQRNVELIIADRNLGFGAGCNLAFARSQTPYLFLLNPDASIHAESLARLVVQLERQPRLAAVAPTVYWDAAKQFIVPTLLPETPLWWLGGALAERWPATVGEAMARHWLKWQRRLHQENSVQSVNALSGGVLLLRRSAIETCGGLFDERYFMFYEDTDLSRRLRRAGYELGLLPQAHAQHRWCNRTNKYALMAESGRQYMNRHYSWLMRLAPYWGGDVAAPFANLALQRRVRPGYLGLGRMEPNPITCPGDLQDRLAGRALRAISPSLRGFPAIFRPQGAPAIGLSEEEWGRLDAGPYTLLLADATGAEHWWSIDIAQSSQSFRPIEPQTIAVR